MDLFAWDEKYNVNIAKMDAQHRSFFHYLYRMQEAVLKKEGDQVIRQTFSDLIEYAERHFRDEEELLWSMAYPDIDVQKRQHRYFAAQVQAMREAYIDANAVPPASVLNFLADWFIHHILEEDKRYGTYLAGLG